MLVTKVRASQMIAVSPGEFSIEGLTNAGTASADDEAGVKNYSVWSDDWSQ